MVPGGVVFFLCPLTIGDGAGVSRLIGPGDDDGGFRFVAGSLGSDAARVFVDENAAGITTGLVVLFEKNVGTGGAFGTLFDEDFIDGVAGGLLVKLEILLIIIMKTSSLEK
jgi:hypothetical protein